MRNLIETFPSRRRAERLQPTTRNYALARPAIPLVSVVSASETGVTIGARTFSQITILFSLPKERDDFSHVNIWVKGYRANTNYVQMAQANISPAILLLEVTSETLTIALQTETLDRHVSDVEKSPTTSVVNNG